MEEKEHEVALRFKRKKNNLIIKIIKNTCYFTDVNITPLNFYFDSDNNVILLNSNKAEIFQFKANNTLDYAESIFSNTFKSRHLKAPNLDKIKQHKSPLILFYLGSVGDVIKLSYDKAMLENVFKTLKAAFDEKNKYNWGKLENETNED